MLVLNLVIIPNDIRTKPEDFEHEHNDQSRRRPQAYSVGGIVFVMPAKTRETSPDYLVSPPEAYLIIVACLLVIFPSVEALSRAVANIARSKADRRCFRHGFPRPQPSQLH